MAGCQRSFKLPSAAASRQSRGRPLPDGLRLIQFTDECDFEGIQNNISLETSRLTATPWLIPGEATGITRGLCVTTTTQRFYLRVGAAEPDEDDAKDLLKWHRLNQQDCEEWLTRLTEKKAQHDYSFEVHVLSAPQLKH